MAAKFFQIPWQCVVINGIAVPGAQLEFLNTGTTTPLPTYTTDALTTQHPHPVRANGAGAVPAIYLDSTKIYRLRVKDKFGSVLDGGDVDPFIPGTVPDASALQPYADDAADSAVAASGSASAAATSATAAASSATAAASSATAAASSASSASTSASSAATSAFGASSSYSAIAAAIAPGSLNNATLNATTRVILKGLNTALSLPAYHDGSMWDLVAYSSVSALVTADTAEGIYARSTYDTAKCWVRRFNGSVNPLWFGFVEGYSGAAGANSTANNAAWTAMMSALGALGKNTSGNFKGIPDILFPVGCFEFSSTPDATVGSVRIRGSGMGHVGATVVTGSTRIKCYGCGGFRFQATNTSGISTGDAGTHQGSDESSLEDIGFEGDFSTTEAEYHGVHIRAQTHCRNVVVSNFAGDGFRVEANSSGIKGNATSSTFINCHGWGCRNGRRWIGNNTGASWCSGGSFNNNRRWGDKNESSIGSTFIGVEYSNNGTVAANDGVTIPATVVGFGGFRYFAIVGQETWCSTNAPTGAATDNQGWAYLSTAAPASGVPAWVSGIVVETGGNFMGSGGNVAIGCYAEAGNEGKAQGQQSDLIIGGKLSLNAWESGTGSASLLVFRADTAGVATFGKAIKTSGSITSTGDKIGYSTGAGGTVTQLSSKSTGVTLDTVCGQITMNNAALSGGAKVSFAVSNNTITATDTVVVNIKSGGTANAYRANVTAISASSFTITVENITAGSLSEAPILNFATIKGIAA